MVFVGGFGGVVFAETFSLGIVIVGDGRPGPFDLALNAEVVVGFHSQPAASVVRFQQGLGHGDAGGMPAFFISSMASPR